MQSSALFSATRRRLVIWNVGIAGAIIVIFALAAYFTAAHMLDGELNQQVDSRISDLQAHLSVDLANGRIDSHEYTADTSGALLVVLSTDGQVLYRSYTDEVSGLPNLEALHATLATGRPDERIVNVGSGQSIELRLSTEAVTAPDGTVLGVMQLGILVQPYEHALSELLLVLMFVGIGGLVLALGSGFFLASRAMAPVRVAFRRQRDFVADASHELRTPLMLVRADVDVLSRGLRSARAKLLAASPTPVLSGTPSQAVEVSESSQARGEVAHLDDQLELAGDALGEIDRMSRLLGDLLLLARMDAGAVALAQEPVLLDELLDDLVAQVRRKAEGQGLRVEIHLGSGACVAGNADQLRRLFLILLDNAMRYNRPDGSITLSSAIVGHRARVTVADTGIG
ncbi:MAG TPA: HAMP domain-containing sensor histidine kinase, partial [Ktedonobacterales bacterium]